jgi:hypothetical protein
MLHNNLDPEVAEHPDRLVVYGGTGKAARDWASFERISACLAELKGDETLLVQSGRPVGVLRTHEWAPRVLIANANLVGDWANWEEFRRLEALGLTMYGQMTAGSWIYIGTQGILQGTYETFAAVAARRGGAHGRGDLSGTLTLTAGLGGMGGAQPLAVTMNGGVALVVECDPSRIERRLSTRYLDVAVGVAAVGGVDPGRACLPDHVRLLLVELQGDVPQTRGIDLQVVADGHVRVRAHGLDETRCTALGVRGGQGCVTHARHGDDEVDGEDDRVDVPVLVAREDHPLLADEG